jgi:hypothetical protein
MALRGALTDITANPPSWQQFAFRTMANYSWMGAPIGCAVENDQFVPNDLAPNRLQSGHVRAFPAHAPLAVASVTAGLRHAP